MFEISNLLRRVNLEDGVTHDEFIKIMENLEDQDDSLVLLDPEDIGRVFETHEKATFGRININKTAAGIGISDFPAWLKEQESECSVVCLFITGDLDLIEGYDAAEQVSGLLPEKTDVLFTLKQTDDPDIKTCVLAA
ncbi:MAG: hypothetical protein IKS11_08125 [Lachnospiraceae bacterium]|nr:hypothetical protein [Lachnospiraceae bacterium]